MNVNDITTKAPVVKDRLEAIFNKQRELMIKYGPIEHKNGFHLNVKEQVVDLHDRHGQALIKDFAWRVTEELTEATEAVDHDPIHFFEEMIDAYHFLTELSLHAGMSNEGVLMYASKHFNIPQPKNHIDGLNQLYFLSADVMTTPNANENIYKIIEYLGLACNCLKQKPWKQTHLLTDTGKFFTYIALAHVAWVAAWESFDRSADDMYQTYFEKSSVNDWRIRTNY